MTFDLHRVSPALGGAWDRASPRERWMVGAAALVVCAALFWVLLWQPLTDDVARLSRDVPRTQLILAASRAQADAIVALERSPRGPRNADAKAAVEQVLTQRGLRQAVTTLDLQDGKLRLAFQAVGFNDLVGALDTLARQEALRVIAATLTARVEPGTVRAELTLAR